MATYDIYVDVDYLDAAERTSTRSYLLREQYDDAANAGEGNMEDVRTSAGLLITALNVLTMSAIPSYSVRIAETGAGSANVAANNQVVAFSRALDTNLDKSSIEVPAWDDVVYDQDSNNLLSDAYNTAAAAALLLLRAPETGVNFGLSTEYTQSRTRKSRNILND